ncbi:MAG: hypothetical protein A2V70_19660 [Planctomycetes bacterium RBG_13_63_9]|nr:MAG: hypothetical protein A2V70_19660 [Planctomycetes bacterium RBG_13_63_9]
MRPTAIGPVSFIVATAAVVLGVAPLGAADEPASAPADPASQSLPAGWLTSWAEPPLADRPLQIVHGIAPERATAETMRYYTDRGLGGLVCNVAFDRYMRSEQHWRTLLAGVEACRQLGAVVWLYDEDGYPSGAAGGLVLEENPAFEATVLAWDASRDDPLVIRHAYEHTHASNNYYAARRYPNLLDDRATRCFIAKTHDAYWQRLKPHFGRTIQAIFTDEPSLMAVHLGQLPEGVRKGVRVADPIDPAVRPLPTVPWSHDLAQQYQQRYGEDLMPRRRSLFMGDSPEDRNVRRQFWALVADLVAERYFGEIQHWCSHHRIASTGHSLWEEALIHHVPLEGNGLKALAQMDIPGLDMLSSDPQAVIHTGWLTAAMPASAAVLGRRRRVMTEVSDFSQRMGEAGPVTLAEMQGTAAWQAAWGVTDFTLYYDITDRSAAEYRAYCDCVGRLTALLKPARPTPEVLLYYPIYDLWAEYLPIAEPLTLQSQSPRAQRIVNSFLQLGQSLQRSQIPFTLIDHEHLAAAMPRPDGSLAVQDHCYKAIVLPSGSQLPPSAAAVLQTFRQRGGRVVDAAEAVGLSRESLVQQLQPPYRILPPSDSIALGRFSRDRRRILLVANVGLRAYDGHLTAESDGTWQTMDPANGAIRPAETDAAGRVRLALAAHQAILLVETPAAKRIPR